MDEVKQVNLIDAMNEVKELRPAAPSDILSLLEKAINSTFENFVGDYHGYEMLPCGSLVSIAERIVEESEQSQMRLREALSHLTED